MKQKLFIVLALLSLLYQPIWAQQSKLQKEINEQVWKPFLESFNKNDKGAFASVHSKDIIRVLQDDKKIWGYDQYFPQVKSDQQGPPQNVSVLELRFTERIAENDKAFEVGYYKNSYTNAKGEKRSSFGKFHVVLRKENGIWKILVDADSREGATEEAFNKGIPVEE